MALTDNLKRIEDGYVALGTMPASRPAPQDDQTFRDATAATLKQLSAIIDIPGMTKDFTYTKDVGQGLLKSKKDNETELAGAILMVDTIEAGAAASRMRPDLKAAAFTAQTTLDALIRNKLGQKKNDDGSPRFTSQEIEAIVKKGPALVRMAQNADAFVKDLDAVVDARPATPGATPPKQTTAPTPPQPSAQQQPAGAQPADVQPAAKPAGGWDAAEAARRLAARRASGGQGGPAQDQGGPTAQNGQGQNGQGQAAQGQGNGQGGAEGTAPVTGPNGMKLEEATSIAEQAMANVYKKATDMGMAMPNPGAVDGNFDEAAATSTNEILGTIASMAGVQYDGAGYTEQFGKDLRAALKDPAKQSMRSLLLEQLAFIQEPDDEKKIDKLFSAFETLRLNKKLDAPSQQVKLDATEKSILGWAFAENPKQTALLNEILIYTAAGYNVKELLGASVPGFERTKDQPVLPADHAQRMMMAFKEAFEGKTYAEAEASLIESIEGIGQLSFGGLARRDAYQKLVKDSLAAARKAAGEDGKNMDLAAKAFADSFSLKNIDALNKQFGSPVYTPTGRMFTEQPTIDRRYWDFTTKDFAEATPDPTKRGVNMVVDAYNELNFGQVIPTPLFFVDSKDGQAYVAGVTAGTGIFTIEKIDIAKIGEAVKSGKEDVTQRDALANNDPGLKWLIENYPGQGATLRVIYNKAMEQPRQELGPDGQPLPRDAKYTVHNGMRTLTGAYSEFHTQSDVQREATRAAQEAAKQNNVPPGSPQIKSKPDDLSRPDRPVNPFPGRPAGDGAPGSTPTAISANWTQPSSTGIYTNEPTRQLQTDRFARTTETGGRDEIKSVFNTYTDREGRVLAEYLDGTDRARVADLSAAAAFMASFTDKAPSRADAKIRESVLEDAHLPKDISPAHRDYAGYVAAVVERKAILERMGLEVPPRPRDAGYAEYVDALRSAKTGVELNRILAELSPDVIALQQDSRYSNIKNLSLGEIVRTAEMKHREVAGGTYNNGVAFFGRRWGRPDQDPHAEGLPDMTTRPALFADGKGNIRAMYVDHETGTVRFADVTAQLKVFRSLGEQHQPGWEKNKPDPEDKNYGRYVEDVLRTRGLDLGELLKRYAPSEDDSFAEIQKSYPGINLLDLVLQVEREHTKFSPNHNHAPGLMTPQFNNARGPGYVEGTPSTREPTTNAERYASVRTEITTLPPDFSQAETSGPVPGQRPTQAPAAPPR